MKQSLLLLSAIVAFIGSAARAGTIAITATGEASQAAEYVAIGVAVHSKCYHKSTEARTANDALASSILQVLNRYVTDETRKRLTDPVTAVGGQFTRQTETAYRSGQTVVLCENGWRTAKYLTLKLLDVAQLPEVQDAILELVDKSPEVSGSGDPQTWAGMDAPTARLTPASEVALIDKALKDAIQKARHELQSIVGVCGIRYVKLVDIRPPSMSHQDKGISAAMKEAAPGHASPFLFGQLTASVTRLFSFEYESGGSQCHQ